MWLYLPKSIGKLMTNNTSLDLLTTSVCGFYCKAEVQFPNVVCCSWFILFLHCSNQHSIIVIVYFFSFFALILQNINIKLLLLGSECCASKQINPFQLLTFDWFLLQVIFPGAKRCADKCELDRQELRYKCAANEINAIASNIRKNKILFT